MAAGRDHRVVGEPLVVGHRLALHLGGGDDAAQIMPRTGAAVGGDGIEIILETEAGLADRRGRVIGEAPHRIFRSDQTPGQFQDQVVVGLGQAEQAHDAADRKRHRDVFGEIECLGAAGDAADDMVGPGLQPRLHRWQRGRREVRLRHRAVGAMFGVVHLQQAAQHIGLAEHPLEALFGHLAGEKRARGSDERSAPALYRRDVAVTAEQPERAHAGGVDPEHRRLSAQQLERRLQACVVGVAVGGNDEAGGSLAIRGRSPRMAATAHQARGTNSLARSP